MGTLSSVFIVAPMQRSGTNFLTDLLSRHDRCARVPDVGEDFILHEAYHLDSFIDRLLVHWRKHQSEWEQERLRCDLETRLGDVVEKTLKEKINDPMGAARYVVTKTPSVQNIDLKDKFFHRAKMIVIVRDGRDTVESGMKSFGWTFRRSAHAWRKGADSIIRYLESKDSGEMLLVRYEDLVRDYRPEISRILEFLGLDEAEFDYHGADVLPVRGSSELRERSSKKVHWSPVERGKDFKPVGRWQRWSKAATEQFSWWAGDQLHYFGYLSETDLQFIRAGWKAKILRIWREFKFSFRLGKSLRKRWYRVRDWAGVNTC